MTNRNGRRWAVLHRHDIRVPGGVLFTRVRILQVPWFGIYFHILRRPDDDRFLHNHPWRFTTLVLKGGYTEEWAGHFFQADYHLDMRKRYGTLWRLGRARPWRRGSIHTMELANYHRIAHLHNDKPCWTILLVGPRKQEWGYHTDKGFIKASQQGPEFDPEEAQPGTKVTP